MQGWTSHQCLPCTLECTLLSLWLTGFCLQPWQLLPLPISWSGNIKTLKKKVVDKVYILYSDHHNSVFVVSCICIVFAWVTFCLFVLFVLELVEFGLFLLYMEICFWFLVTDLIIKYHAFLTVFLFDSDFSLSYVHVDYPHVHSHTWYMFCSICGQRMTLELFIVNICHLIFLYWKSWYIYSSCLENRMNFL